METESQSDKNVIFEKILRQLGGFGRFQWFMLALSLFSSMCCAFNHLSMIYKMFTPSFQCGDLGSPLESAKRVSSWLKISVTSLNSFLFQVFNSSCPSGDSSQCNDIKFDDDVMSRTVVTSFGLVCDRIPLVPTVASSYIAGVSLECHYFETFADMVDFRL